MPRSTNADVWDEWADEDEDDDFLSPEMRERLKALDAETVTSNKRCSERANPRGAGSISLVLECTPFRPGGTYSTE